MAIIELKKAKIAVANIITVVAVFLICENSFAQVANQKFHGNDGLDWTFESDSFKVASIGIAVDADKKVFKGIYEVKGDTLIMNYIPFEDPPKPHFKFIEKRALQNTTKSDTVKEGVIIHVHFKVTDINGNPIVPSPIVLLKNQKNKTIEGLPADSSGHIPEVFIFGTFSGYFDFTSLANKELIISADTLAGFRSTVWVKLPKRIQYSDFSGTKKFLISKMSDKKIELQSLESDKKIILSKMN